MTAHSHTPREAFAFVAQHLRPQDTVCIGIFPKDKPDMLAEDVSLFAEAVSLFAIRNSQFAIRNSQRRLQWISIVLNQERK